MLAGCLLLVAAACGSGGGKAASRTTTTAPAATIAPTTTTIAHTAADALHLVQRIYAPYDTRGRLPQAPPATLGACFISPDAGACAGPLDTYLAPALIDRLRAQAATGNYDPVICAQNYPSRVSYGDATVADGQAVIPVHTFFEASGENPITVTVDLETLKLTRLSCPAYP